MTARISSINLNVNSLDKIADFYSNILGMQVSNEPEDAVSCAFTTEGCKITFNNKSDLTDYVARDNGFYWKIGITVKNLIVASKYLKKNGIVVTEPRQFKDIGYMCHLRDPAGFSIELLQCGFEGKEQPVPDGHPIGVQATLAHITLRVTDIIAAQQYFEHTLGMRLMSVQPVSDYHFCLYFYTWTDDTLPDPNLASVKNRQWLWARPYTLVELQRLQAPDATIHKAGPGEAGFNGFTFRTSTSEQLTEVSLSDLETLE